MANYCNIKNTKNLKPEELISIVEKQLKDTFKFTNIQSTWDNKENSFEIKINQISFVFYKNKENIEFFDCPDTGMTKTNQNKYTDQAFENAFYYHGMTCAFSFIYEYIKHFVASTMQTNLDSDGVGERDCEFDHSKFNSFPKWMDYYEEKAKKQGILKKIIKLGIPNKEQILKNEKTYFPEVYLNE